MRNPVPHKQEIVKIQLTAPAKSQNDQSLHNGVMELSIAGTVLQIPNGTDPSLLRQTLQIRKELSC
ncbi:hypothetical protein [Suilimivivens sp.]|uniref:hypothetical protein n=1 Tax=Suilimivivens sp. TaxID=2981669 RepID=UPI00307C91DA